MCTSYQHAIVLTDPPTVVFTGIPSSRRLRPTLVLEEEPGDAAIMPPEGPHQEHVHHKSIRQHKQPYGDDSLLLAWRLHVQQGHYKGHREIPAHSTYALEH